MTSRYIYFISKSSTVIYKLCIGKGTAKERLRECEVDINIMLHAPVPERLLPLKEKIENNLFIQDLEALVKKVRLHWLNLYMGNETQQLQNILKTFMIYIIKFNYLLIILNKISQLARASCSCPQTRSI